MPMFAYLDPACCRRAAPAVRAEIQMDTDTVFWEYDPEQRLLALDERHAHEDGNSGEQVNAANVVIMETPYRPSYVDSNSPEAVTIGGGAVWVLGRHGATGSWLRSSRTEGIGLFADDGSVIELLPGRTWVELADPDDAPPSSPDRTGNAWVEARTAPARYDREP